jgi:hypothetical protein
MRTARRAHIDWAVVEELKPFGGIRIEDNVAATAAAPENMTRDAFARVEAPRRNAAESGRRPWPVDRAAPRPFCALGPLHLAGIGAAFFDFFGALPALASSFFSAATEHRPAA